MVTANVQMVAWKLRLLQTCILKNTLSQEEKGPLFIARRRFAFAKRTTFQNRVINMYVKSGNLVDARKMFDNMKERDIVSWNTIIVAYRRYEVPHEAVALFHQMQRTGFHPNEFTFASVLPACAKIGALERGMEIHQTIKDIEILSNIVVANALVDLYAKCGRVDKARELFDRMSERDVISWTAMIVGYAHNGYIEKTLETFKQMQLAGVKPNSTTFASILPSCARMGALEQGMAIHQSITEGGFLSDVVVVSALVDMYAKCGSIDKARELFDRMPQRTVVSWTAMIVGYTQNGLVGKALETFKQMKLEAIKPNSTTFASILPVCAKMGALELGMDIHQSITEGGLLSDVVGNALVDMYAKCGSIDKACEVFDRMPLRNVVSWTAMIVGYVHNGFVERALETFKKMQLEGVKPNSTTFASILPACAKVGALKQGMGIHQSILEGGFLSDVVVAIALIDMYAKCGSINKARQLFDKIPQRNVVSWNAMIVGYAQNGFVEKALEIFKQMQLTGVKPNSTTFASILPACAKMGALEQGIDIHQSIAEREILSDVVVANALLDMYAKCGRIDKAHELFDKMPKRNVVSWTAMIAGHAGLVDEGCTYFNQMSNHYCIAPTGDHYMCMVDLLARAGYLEDTLNFIIKMPVKPLVVVWICFLGACRLHMNIGLGVFTATLLFDLDPKNAATYVLLSNIYAEVGCWSEAQMVRRLMKDRGIIKIPGCSWIEVHKIIHTFCVGDRSHPDTGDLCNKFREIGLLDEGNREFSRFKTFRDNGLAGDYW
ncbi:pentatricopeptide repeat-containing protein At1g15510, chloroplastic isoform X2 [Cryptomeria japonica]|uniref:pentatricopeptide repeat-containing protein At1g15510, chloroplastic isoform X2 n=1 Tax=Cryptomeria japonica TaxID=3369 RepID=UPI0027DA5A3B|nr:pentatricopeptide repeat-containing protein At1g15510, chloroplastic isoform X2 [Cryptomeria japonica]